VFLSLKAFFSLLGDRNRRRKRKVVILNALGTALRSAQQREGNKLTPPPVAFALANAHGLQPLSQNFSSQSQATAVHRAQNNAAIMLDWYGICSIWLSANTVPIKSQNVIVCLSEALFGDPRAR
jgi:hypothetical protein